MKLFHRALTWGFWGAAVSLPFILFILPTRTFARFSGLDGGTISKFQGLLFFVAAFFAVLCYGFKSFLSEARRSELPLPRINFGRSHRFFAILNMALSLALVVITTLSLDTPLDIDENIHAIMMTRKLFAAELNPAKSDASIFFTQNHVVAQAASILSMMTWGYHKIPYRLPAVGFTLLLLFVVPLLYQRIFSTFGYSLFLGFLGANAFSLWYLHSARGYVSLMAVTLATYVIALRGSEGERPLSRSLIGIYTVCFVLAAFTHFFAMVFHLLLTASLIFYGYFNRKSLSKVTSQNLVRMLMAGILVTPLYLWVLGNNFIFLSRIGDFQKSEAFNLWANVIKANGFSFGWQGRGTLLFAALLLTYSFFHRRELFFRFSSVFIGLVVLFLGTVLQLMDAKVFESRFILAFTLPFAFWLIDATFHLGWLKKWSFIPLVGCLIVFPLIGHRAVHQTLTMNLQGFDHFMKLVIKKTSPVSENCYVFSGKRDLTVFARDFYLKEARSGVIASEGETDCPVFYHLRMEPLLGDGTVEWSVPPNATEVWNGKKGMALYLQSGHSGIALRTEGNF